MKKLLLIASCILLSSAVFAQGTQKMWLSGKVGFNSSSNDNDDKVTMGYVAPSFGYNITEHISAGIGVGYESTKEEEKDFSGATISTTTTEILVMPFVRYYRVVCEKVMMYGELNVGFGSGKIDWSEYDDDDTYSKFCVAVSPGIQYWICDRWSINAVLGLLEYCSYNDKGDISGQDDFKSNEFSAGVKFSRVRFGANFHF